MSRASRTGSKAPAVEPDPVVAAVQQRAQAQADAAVKASAAPQAKRAAKGKAGKMKRPAAAPPIDDETSSNGPPSEGGSDEPLVKRTKIDGKQAATGVPTSCKSGGAPPVDQLGKAGKSKSKSKSKGTAGKGNGDAQLTPVKLEPKAEAEGSASAEPEEPLVEAAAEALAEPVEPLVEAAAEAPAGRAPPRPKPAASSPAPAQQSDEQKALSQGKMPKGVQAALDHLKQNEYDISKMSQQDLLAALPADVLKRAFAGMNYKLSTQAPSLYRRYDTSARSLGV